jgi:CheY-like chemotaxis protein
MDDEPGDIFFLRRRLFQAGLRDAAAAFESAVDAMVYLRAISHADRTPAWVFIDVTMPEMPGLHLLRQLRGMPSFGAVRIAMFSNSVRPNEVDEAAAIGADAYLLKFPTPALLAEMIADPSLRVGLPGGKRIGSATLLV